jgi:hypothetical protein
MGGGMLIDPRGRVWPDDSWDVARRVGYNDARDDIATFAVRERGFVHLRPRADGMHVALREGRFNLNAFAGLMLELGRTRPPRILLSVLGEGPPIFRIFLDLHDFGAEVEPLLAGKAIEIRVPRLAERRSRRVLNLPTFACARPIVDLWEHTRGELSADVNAALIAGGVLDRMVLLRQLPRSDRFSTEHFGSSITYMKPDDILGRDIRQQHDIEYGVWMGQGYADVLCTRRLLVESCRARIRTKAGTIVHARYDRVLMPWRRKNDALFAMCISIQRGTPIEVPSSAA